MTKAVTATDQLWRRVWGRCRGEHVKTSRRYCAHYPSSCWSSPSAGASMGCPPNCTRRRWIFLATKLNLQKSQRHLLTDYQQTYLKYEESPSPTTAKSRLVRVSWGRSLLRRKRQKFFMLSGGSPWPVVAHTNMQRDSVINCSWGNGITPHFLQYTPGHVSLTTLWAWHYNEAGVLTGLEFIKLVCCSLHTQHTIIIIIDNNFITWTSSRQSLWPSTWRKHRAISFPAPLGGKENEIIRQSLSLAEKL